MSKDAALVPSGHDASCNRKVVRNRAGDIRDAMQRVGDIRLAMQWVGDIRLATSRCGTLRAH